MTINVSKIFEERPNQWGLRGDPLLWDDFEKHFSRFSIPYPEKEFQTEFKNAFIKFTGCQFNSKDDIHVLEYCHGGMSSGMICADFWVHIAFPLLIERLCKLNQVK